MVEIEIESRNEESNIVVKSYGKVVDKKEFELSPVKVFVSKGEFVERFEMIAFVRDSRVKFFADDVMISSCNGYVYVFLK